MSSIRAGGSSAVPPVRGPGDGVWTCVASTSAAASTALTGASASVQRATESLGVAAAAQLLLGLALDLADALAAQPQRLPDLLKGLGLVAVQAEAHAQHVALLLVQLRHQVVDLLLEGGAHELQLDGRDRVLLKG